MISLGSLWSTYLSSSSFYQLSVLQEPYYSRFQLEINGISFLLSHRIAAKFAKLSNRNLLAVSLVVVLIGSILFGDWQSIGDDPCNSFIIKEAIGECGDIYSGASNETAVNDEYVTNTSVFVEGCQALSTSGNDCFWNRQSRVTGEYCYECLPTCLSSQKSHNIYQLGLAMLLLSLIINLEFVFVVAISSDISQLKSQVCNTLF